MQLGIGLGINRLQGGGFSPALLFSAGEVGAWYDPSDLTTLIQDEAGTTPVTAAGQSVGLVLDKSKGLTLGAELVTNGTFDTDVSGWTNNLSGGTITWVSPGAMRIESISGGDVRVSGIVTPGKYYQVSFDLLNTNAANTLRLSVGGAWYFIAAADQTGTPKSYNVIVLCGGGSNFALEPYGGLTCTVDNVSVRELPGNHASQFSSTFRSVYQTGPARQVYDGSDDRDVSLLVPTTAGTLAARFNGSTASRVAIGSQGATDGRCFLALAADGSVAAGIGTQTTATIKGTNDVRNAWTTGVVTWDGSNVFLYENGVQVYTGAQSGAVNTTVAMMRGCLNNNGTAASFWAGSISPTIALNRAMTAAEVLNLHTRWSAIQ